MQPLSILVHIKAMDLVFNTVQYMDSKDSNWNKLSPTQVDLVRELGI